MAGANRFGRDVFSRMKVEADRPVQIKTFIGSYTSLTCENLPGEQAHRVLNALGLDPATFKAVPEDDETEADHLFILRHTLMNPWLLGGPGDENYIDRYWRYLESVVDEVLAES